ncbi:MAG TPA: hypothetical protein VF556_06430 [Pyrinomonadaceae bacterium]|jgi:tetratricopeptide (TPR) repeat protein
MKTLYNFILWSILFIFASNIFAQQTDQGIELYKKGEFQGAIAVLKNSDDVKALLYLGLTYEKVNENGKAKDAFKRAFAKSYDIFFDAVIEEQKISGGAKKGFSDLLQKMKINNQIGLSAAEKAYNLDSGIFQTNESRIKAKVLSDTINLAEEKIEIFSSSDGLTSNIDITEKPRAVSPKDNQGIPFVRRNQSPNKPILVTLFVVFGIDGKIKLIMPIDNLIDAYTVEGLKAATEIKFKPATKDNKPVAYLSKIQYSFSFR